MIINNMINEMHLNWFLLLTLKLVYMLLRNKNKIKISLSKIKVNNYQFFDESELSSIFNIN